MHWNSGTINIIDVWADMVCKPRLVALTFCQFEIVRIKTPRRRFTDPLTRGCARMATIGLIEIDSTKKFHTIPCSPGGSTPPGLAMRWA